MTLVLLHGLSETYEIWHISGYVESLKKEYRLILIDARGHGDSDKPHDSEAYTMKLMVSDVVAVLDDLKISKAHFLGYSMGGMIAQELVLTYPERVAKLVLCSTGSRWCFSQEASRILDAMTELSQEELTKMVLSLKFACDFPSDFVRKKPSVVILFTSDFVNEHPDLVDLLILRAAKHPISKEGWIRQLNAIRGFNTHRRLQKIRVPTLILHGRKDVEIPPENGSILAEVIPNAKLVYLEKSAHRLAEEMKEVISLLIDFLA